MGGDHAPRAVVEGVALAVQEGIADPADMCLVGPEEALTGLLADHDLAAVPVVPATETIEMDESPAVVRTKRDSSIVVGTRYVAEGHAQAFLSAGNTGAVVAASSLVLGRLPGVARPGIAVPMPTRRGPAVIIDVGANIYCKPEHMLQYAVMASEYCKAVFDRPAPRVGLLNIGEEEGKGNPLIQSVHGLLQAQAGLNYAGFVEGQDILVGDTDVVVCEGFVGNVILKVAEGLGQFLVEKVHESLADHPPRAEVGQALGAAFAQLDYAEYGGAPLLGVTAPVLIGHGRSSPHAFMNMIRAAGTIVEHDVNTHITERLAAGSGKAIT